MLLSPVGAGLKEANVHGAKCLNSDLKCKSCPDRGLRARDCEGLKGGKRGRLIVNAHLEELIKSAS